MKLWFAAALLLVGLATAPAQAQITNGSFENGNFTGVNGFGDTGVTRLFAGDTNITGWSIVGELAWLQNPNNYGLLPSNGSRFLDLTGYNNSTPYGGVEQTINTTAGAKYNLTFDIGVDNSAGVFAGPVSITASAGASSQIFTNNLGGPGNQWQSESFQFTAVGSTTLIELQGHSGIDYIGLDNVAVTPASPVPEVGSLFSMVGLLAAGGTGLWLKRRRSR